MKAIIKEFYDLSMGNLLFYEAKTHRRFFTQAEFEKNKGKIFLVSAVKDRADKYLKKETTKSK